MLTTLFSKKVVGLLLTSSTCDVYCIYFKNIKNIVLSALFDFWAFVYKQFILGFDISSCFDMLPVVSFLLVLISVCLWNRQLY